MGQRSVGQIPTISGTETSCDAAIRAIEGSTQIKPSSVLYSAVDWKKDCFCLINTRTQFVADGITLVHGCLLGIKLTAWFETTYISCRFSSRMPTMYSDLLRFP